MKTILTTICTLLLCLSMTAQPLAIPKHHEHEGHDHKEHNHAHAKKASISFIKNLGQWHGNVRYKASLGGINKVYLEENNFTYVFADPKDAASLHDIGHVIGPDRPINMHAYRVHFKNAQTKLFKEEGKHQEYHNYYLGNDQSKWATEVPLFDKITYTELYEGIRLDAYHQEGLFKYDLIVSPGVDPSIIQLEYEGTDGLEIDDGHLIIHTSVEQIIEQKPYAYQLIDGKEIEVKCDYELVGDQVTFSFPTGYNRDHDLIIDPTVVASTLSGTVGDGNFGHTATFDNEGNIYAGGRSFGDGYPVTSGAFQVFYASGQTDIAVTKYNPTGTAQIYATYIGGNSADYPHSMVVDFSGQLLILGTTSSYDYPVQSNAFQSTKGLNADIVVTKLNASGTGLIGSTFVGGSGADGENISGLNYNYDDRYRGEIVLDNQGNAYIASCTTSDNFPVTNNAFDTDLNTNTNGSSPVQDGVVFKLNSDLSTMFWATYLGGDDADGAFGIRVDDFGKTYVTGFAGSSNFPSTPGTVQANWPGGEEAAFIVAFNASGSVMEAGTFWGSSGDEHGFFLDIDEDDNIHIYGKTTGTMPITPNTYSFNNGSRLFLSSFTNDLTSNIYSTVIGTGPNSPFNELVPVAFMVDKCNNIYFSCYYASANLPTTADAISTVGGTVYLGVLDPLATSLQFGTYYGFADHVDGGTSRFDKSGTVYQGVCSCTSSGILNTLPNSFATTQSTFCDIGVFKIDFEIPTVTAAGVALPSPSGCAPYEVDFFYTGQDATVFFWDFDDGGATSTQENPTHTFDEPGTYEITLVASNTLTCNSVDTTVLIIDVLDASSTLTDTVICNQDETIFLDATTTNASYTWHDGSNTATYSANGPGVYWVDVSLLNGACTRRDSFVLSLNNSLNVDIGPDFSVCDELNSTLDATTTGAISYEWNDGSTDPTLQITASGIYSVSVYDSDGCAVVDDIEVTFSTTPVFDLGPDTTLCDLYTLPLDPGFPGLEYTWQDGSTNNTFTVEDPGTYWVLVDNQGCIGSDTIEVSYLAEVFLDIDSSNINCFEDCNGFIDMTISGGNGQLNFEWSTGSTDPDLFDLCAGAYTLTITDDLCNYVLSTVNITEPLPLIYDIGIIDVPCPGDGSGVIDISTIEGGTPPYQFTLNNGSPTSNPIFNNLDGGDYELLIIDSNGCTELELINVYEPPAITISAGPDQTIELGESVELDGLVFPSSGQFISWSPGDSLSCTTCIEPIANPSNTTLYTLSVTDSITGCVLTDEVLVRVEKNRNVFIPNVFSPNGDGTNDIFTIYTGNGVRKINKFNVYDRWGALLYSGDNIYPGNHTSFGWDGFFKGKEMNNAVFTWYAEVEFLDDEIILYKGDVTLVK